MPYETVQYPKTDVDTGSEVSVHWSKDAYVQLQVQRHMWKMPAEAYDDTCDTSPQRSEPPVGTVKATDAQIAYKIREATCSGHKDDSGCELYDERPDEWVVVRLNGAVETCTGEQIADWPEVFYPSDSGCTLSQTVWTDPLSRSDVNRFVRMLRKARDDVFEADA